MNRRVALPKLKKWRKWITQDILPEMVSLLSTMIIYKKIEHVVRTRENLPSRNSFYLWFRHTYASTVSSAIRRQTDLDSRCISMARLLSEIKQNPELIVRSDYVRSEKPRNDIDRRILRKETERLNDEFTKLAGVGDHLDSAVISKDYESISKLHNADVTRLVEFTDWHIAHHDKRQRRGSHKLPTNIEVETYIETLLCLFRKYYQLVTGHGVQLIDDIQTWNLERDIEIIFESPRQRSTDVPVK